MNIAISRIAVGACLLVAFAMVIRSQPAAAAEDKDLGTTLRAAAQKGDFPQVQQFVQTHPELINAAAPWATKNGRYDGWTALHWAVDRDDRAMVEFLLRYGAEAKGGPKCPWPPLGLTQSDALAAMLLAAGADLEATDAAGQRPIDKARNAAIARLFIEKGAKIDGGDAV